MFSPLASALANSLLLLSPPAAPGSQCSGSVPTLSTQHHPLAASAAAQDSARQLEQLIAQLRLGLQQGQDDDELRARLWLEIEGLRHFPDRRAEDSALEALFGEAMLVLAASMQACDPSSAERWIERALASQERALGAALPPELTGLPAEFVALYEQRARALSSAEPATIWLHCESACSVFVDGHRVPVVLGEVEEHTVLPGAHDVWFFHTPSGASTFDEPTRVSVTELELGADEQSYLPFPTPRDLGLLPSREQWWSMWSFAQRSAWAIESKKSRVDFETSSFEALIDESPAHARVYAQSRRARELRVRVALHLADLWQQGERVEAAAALLDRTLLWAQLGGSHDELAAAVAKFPSLVEIFDERVALMAAQPRGTVEVDCLRCLPLIDGVHVDSHSIELPAGRHTIELQLGSLGGEHRVFDDLLVRSDRLRLLRTEAPRRTEFVPEPVDFEQSYRRDPELQRWVWGTAGGVLLAGAAVWSFALTTWQAPKLRETGIDDSSMDLPTFESERKAQHITIGLSVAGAVFVHAELAAYCFSRIAPPRRPGTRMMSIGTGLLLSSLASAGHAITGYLSWRRAHDDTKGYGEETLEYKKYEDQRDASANVGWVGAFATGALAVSGVTLVSIGSERSRSARQAEFLRPARRAPSERPGVVPIILGSGLMVAGASFVGLGGAGLALEPEPSAAALVGLIGGASMGLSGAVLVAVGATRKRASKSRASVAPLLSPNSLGLQLLGRF